MDGMLDGHDKRCGEVEPDSSPSRKVSRLELNVKKDSGYGSQGLITVDQVPIPQLLVNLSIVKITNLSGGSISLSNLCRPLTPPRFEPGTAVTCRLSFMSELPITNELSS